MRNRNLISMIYANLEKTRAAAEKAAQTNARPATPVGGCCCERRGHTCAIDRDQQNKNGLSFSTLPTEQEVMP